MHIYIHVPFCAQICSYCDFCKTEVSSSTQIDDYLQALDAELTNRSSELRTPADTIYVGGGTPTRLGLHATERFITILDRHITRANECEFSYEADPCTTTRSQLEILFNAGVNRISIGAQSWSPAILKEMSRLHQPEDTDALVAELHDIGFPNISLDLIVGWPRQTEADIHTAITRVSTLGCQHVSTYMLMVEPSTPLSEQIKRGSTPALPDDKASALYHTLRSRLVSDGYQHYEISNFSKPEYSSRHNQGYWEHRDHAGFGPGAVGLTHGIRRHNTRDIAAYLLDPIESATHETLTAIDLRNEHLMLGLRTSSGVDSNLLKHVSPARLQHFIDAGYLIGDDTRLAVNPEHYMVSNNIISELFES